METQDAMTTTDEIQEKLEFLTEALVACMNLVNCLTMDIEAIADAKEACKAKRRMAGTCQECR